MKFHLMKHVLHLDTSSCMKLYHSYYIEVSPDVFLRQSWNVMKCVFQCQFFIEVLRNSRNSSQWQLSSEFATKSLELCDGCWDWGASHGASSANNGWKWMNGSHRTVGCSCLWMFATSMRLFFLPCAIVGVSASFVKSHEWKSNIQLRVSGT